ncbi:MAG TPA: Ku protein [Gemmatimonadaceae bacterium]|jgi:DNA end-binding protein Ku|nr:Ku protein [Gemmatimonadaceae bacterium]
MASIWKGSLTFGLVNVPVELKTAVRSDHISFRMLHGDDMAPIKYERVCSADGEPVPWNETVKGYEYQKGQYVVLTPEDFKAAALEQSRTLDILDFVKQDEIDPRYFDTPYFLVPGKNGERAYALLREAIRETGSVGVGKIIIRQKQHLAGVKVVGDALVLELMRFKHELIEESEYSFPSAENVRPQELQMARQLIDSLAEPFTPDKYTDEYEENLMRIIRAKAKGQKITLEAPEAPAADDKVLDLMARLRESLEQGRAAKERRAVRAEPKAAAAGEKKPPSKKRRRPA